VHKLNTVSVVKEFVLEFDSVGRHRI